jgi:hypothetical protein
MASIGDNFTQPVPPVDSPGPAYATQVNAVLTELITRVSSSVPFSTLSGSQLDMGNVPIISAQYVGLHEQPTSPGASPVGRLERYQDNIYWVGPVGAVRITDGDKLDAGGIGGIEGDYGGGNPASFRFVDINTRYEAYDDFNSGIWAYVRSRGVDIMGGATSSNAVSLRYAGAVNYTLTLPPTAVSGSGGNRALQVDNSGQISYNSAASPCSVDLHLSSTSRIIHGNRVVTYLPEYSLGTNLSLDHDQRGLICAAILGSPAHVSVGIPASQHGTRIKSVVARVFKSGTSASTLTFLRYQFGTGATTINSVPDSTAGFRTITVFSGTHTVLDNNTYQLEWRPSNAGEYLHSVQVTWDVV